MQPSRYRLLILLLVTLPAVAFGQPTPRIGSDQVEFELGIHGAVVENSWNPLRLVLRDLPPVEFELRIDQGSLRSGSIPLVYTASIGSSRGLSVFEDEVFIPPWSSLSWTLRSADRTVASGSMDPRLRDRRPLTLLLSSEPGSWLAHLPAEARPQEVVAGELPATAAGYSGVAALIVDGTATAPTLESIVAAAAAGVAVILVEPLPGSHAALTELYGPAGSFQRLGAGWIVSTRREGVAPALARYQGFPMQGAAAALAGGREQLEGPDYNRVTIIAAGAVYALLVLLLLRFGGSAGIPAALVVAALAVVAGWLALRPAEAVLEEERTLVVSSGGLGLSLPTLAVRSLPGGEVEVNSQMRMSEQLAYSVSGGTTRLSLGRWQRQLLLGKPALTGGALAWFDDRLENRGTTLLRDVLVLGLGPQPPIEPGGLLAARPSEEMPSPEAYGDLLELLPPGTALANDGRRYLVALPAAPGDSL